MRRIDLFHTRSRYASVNFVASSHGMVDAPDYYLLGSAIRETCQSAAAYTSCPLARLYISGSEGCMDTAQTLLAEIHVIVPCTADWPFTLPQFVAISKSSGLLTRACALTPSSNVSLTSQWAEGRSSSSSLGLQPIASWDCRQSSWARSPASRKRLAWPSQSGKHDQRTFRGARCEQ